MHSSPKSRVVRDVRPAGLDRALAARVTRSRRKTPIVGATAAGSEKDDKQASHRKLRRAVRQLIPCGRDDSLPVEQELTNP